MEKSNITTRIATLFLISILVAGIITSIFSPSLSSPLMTEAHAALSDYGMMMMTEDHDYNYKYSSPYEKDDINCNNFNLNLNGGGLIVDGIPESLNDILAAQAQTEGGAHIGTGAYGIDEKRFSSYDKDFVYKCVNNNFNELRLSPTSTPMPPTPPTTPPPTPPPAVNNVYVTWRDNTPGNYDTFFAVSNNNGQIFGTPINLSNNTGTSEAQQIATIGNNVYVTWQDNTPGNFEIFFAASDDNGQTFTNPPLNLSNNTGDSLNPQIAAVGNNVYVTWTGEPLGGGNFEIFFAASDDNGQTFTNPPLNLSNSTGVSFDPQIAAVGNNAYVTWIDGTSGNFEILFAASDDNGQTFTNPPLNISNNSGDSTSPEITAVGDNVYVTWTDNTSGNFEILFAASDDNGQTFTNPPLNLSNTLDGSSNSQIAAVDNNVYVTWQDGNLSNADIFFAASDDNGQTFTNPPLNLSNNTGLSFAPQIAAIADNVYVTWRDNTLGNTDIFFAASDDNGQTFTNPPLNLSNSTGESDHPSITVLRNNVYVTWDDNTIGNLEIAFAASDDNGQTFTNPPLNLSNNNGDSIEPQISSSASQENQGSGIQMTNPTQQTVSPAAFQQQQPEEDDSPIITQETEEDLSALEKIEKLKSQWLELLP